jgi:hypothetical protein
MTTIVMMVMWLHQNFIWHTQRARKFEEKEKKKKKKRRKKKKKKGTVSVG